MKTSAEAVFMLDCDNTLRDNGRVQVDLRAHLEREFGAANRDRYWEILEALRAELGYADYLGALQRYRLGAMSDPCLLQMSAFLLDYHPAADLTDMRGIERRAAAGLEPRVRSVASLFVSRWDVAVKDKVPAALANQLGIAIARRTYRAHRELLVSPRWRKLEEAGAAQQRLLWASTGAKDPAAPDTLYLEALATPGTINTIPDKTLLAFADHGVVNGSMPADGGDAEKVLAAFAQAGVDEATLATQLQREGVESFSKSWSDLMAIIAGKSATLAKNQPGEGAHS